MPSLIRKEKITCDSCGTQTTRSSFVRHKKRCSADLVLIQCPNFSSSCQIVLNHHIVEKHSAPKLDVTFKGKLYYQEFSGFCNIKTPSMAFLSEKQMLILTKLSMKWMIPISKRSCLLVIISWWILNLKKRDTKCSITQWKTSTKQS